MPTVVAGTGGPVPLHNSTHRGDLLFLHVPVGQPVRQVPPDRDRITSRGNWKPANTEGEPEDITPASLPPAAIGHSNTAGDTRFRHPQPTTAPTGVSRTIVLPCLW
jgi:hypothetical protein